MSILPAGGACPRIRNRTVLSLTLAAFAVLGVAACKKETPPAAKPPVDVTVMTVNARDTPVEFEYTAQTQSSREVEIRARVEGFLERRLYREGDLVKAGQVLFQMDRKPFEAALQSAKGQLAQQEARREVARANLARVRPLAEQNALSKKDLDDAVGSDKAAEAAVIAAQGQVQTAQLNLSYTTIATPLTGISSYARKQEGSYLTPGEGGFLTNVSQLDPMWVNFSISENELLKLREDVTGNRLRFPKQNDFEVEVVLADGTVVPNRGRVSFADPSFSKETGTFLVRAVFANPKGLMRPGQFVRARVSGAVRPNAIMVPQRAVMQGQKSHFVWVVNKEGKAEQRVVEPGEWYGDDWFINQGLRAGERIVVDGAIRVAAGAPLKVAEATVKPASAGTVRKAAEVIPPEAERLNPKAAPPAKSGPTTAP